jgi:hypothetical protein
MTQTMYAHVNKCIKNSRINNITCKTVAGNNLGVGTSGKGDHERRRQSTM